MGNGESIKVWNDLWLGGAGTHFVPSPINNADEELQVSSLLDRENNCWNMEAVSAAVVEEDRQAVLDIPLPQSWRADSRFWWPTSDGIYTVRSGYWLGQMGKLRTWELFNGQGVRDLWSLVWKVEGPPKLRHFLWRACKGSLGTMSVLHRRHIRSSSECSVCGYGDETIMHTLFECKYALEIWKHSELSGLLVNAPALSFEQRFVWLVDKVDREQLSTFASLTWATWFCRNKHVFEAQVSVDPISVAAGFVKLKVDYLAYARRVGPTGGVASLPSRVSSAVAWSPPPPGVVKVNVDAHIRNEGGVQFGMVARDDSGKLVATGVRRMAVNWDPCLAEAGAARFGVEIAHRLRLTKVILECDALRVVKDIQARKRGAAPIYILLDDIVNASVLFSSFHCVHDKRAGNTLAYNVARWEAVNGSDYVCTHSFPQGIQTLAEIDLL